MEADTAAIRRFGTITTDLAAIARAAPDADVGECGAVAERFVAALRTAVASHVTEVVALGDILEQAALAAFATADGYVGSDRDAAGLIGT